MFSLYRGIPVGVWRTAFYLCLAAILILSLGPANVQVISTGWDKANHLVAFTALAFLLMHAHRLNHSKVFLVLLAIGALIEMLQSHTPNRYAEWYDLMADAIGIVLGISVAIVLNSLALQLDRSGDPMTD